LKCGSNALSERSESKDEIKNNGRRQLITVNFYAPPAY